MSDGLFGDPLVDAALDALRRIPDWPFDEVKDERLIRSLMAEYPSENIARQIEAWHGWLVKKNPEVKDWRARIRTWMRQGSRYGIEARSNRIGTGRSQSGGGGAGGKSLPGSRTSSRAGTVGEHAPTGRVEF